MKYLISIRKLKQLMTDSYNFGRNNGWLEHFEELRDRELDKLRNSAKQINEERSGEE